MPRFFEDEDPELEEEPRRDTEVTLSPSGLAGIVLALLVLCGLCFGFGYWAGHRAPRADESSSAQSLNKTAAPDAEPLQGSNSIPKPSADAQVPVTPAQASGAAQPQQPAPNPAGPQPGTPITGQSAPPPASPPASAPGQSQPAPGQSQVRQAMSSAAGNSQTQAEGAAPMVHPALPGPNALMVQVAAVSHQEDASVLVGALRNRGYVASAQRDPSDELIHVRIGPFTNRDDANRTARKLLDDGYNAMVQP